MATRLAVPGRHWHRLEDGQVQCDVCPRECRLQEGQRGLCFVRQRQNDEIVLTTWGRSSGFCIDPVEKKPLNHFYPGTPVLSFGTAGCNLTCKFCQNHSISKSREMDSLAASATPDKIAEVAQSRGCWSVAYTYNDPVIFLEYAVDVAEACHAQGVFNIAVTAGYIHRAPMEEFFRPMDAVNLDLKAFTERFYKRLCTGSLGAVQDTACYIRHETGVWLELTTLLIPGENDGEAEIEELCQWVLEALGDDVPLHFSAFHPDFRMMDVPATPVETLLRARKQALAAGLKYVYCGNVHHEESDATWCPGCGESVIGRDWYTLKDWRLRHGGYCEGCGTAVAGRFAERPGLWGSRREVVQL